MVFLVAKGTSGRPGPLLKIISLHNNGLVRLSLALGFEDLFTQRFKSGVSESVQNVCHNTQRFSPRKHLPFLSLLLAHSFFFPLLLPGWHLHFIFVNKDVFYIFLYFLGLPRIKSREVG